MWHTLYKTNKKKRESKNSMLFNKIKGYNMRKLYKIILWKECFVKVSLFLGQDGGVCALWFLSNIYLFHLLQKEKSDFIAAMKCKQDLICLVDILQHLI